MLLRNGQVNTFGGGTIYFAGDGSYVVLYIYIYMCVFLILATEEQSDDGLPHTLEHLVFLGSELYPYKGILDQLANKCLASGTYAWTGRMR